MMLFYILLCFLWTTSSASNYCRPQEIYDGSMKKCYAYFQVQGALKSAESTCERIGYALVKILNAPQNSFVTAFATDNLDRTYGLFLTGGSYVSGNWTWMDGTPMNYTNWIAGEPTLDKNCTAVRLSDSRWQTVACDERYQFVCEGDAGQPFPTGDPSGTCPPCAPIEL